MGVSMVLGSLTCRAFGCSVSAVQTAADTGWPTLLYFLSI